MPFTQTEQYTIWLHDAASGVLTLVPATTQRPWRLMQREELLADIPLPPDVEATVLLGAVQAVVVARGWNVIACGACARWQTLDAEPTSGMGACTWQLSDRSPGASARQNALAAPCTHFSTAAGPPPRAIAAAPSAAPAVPLTWWNRLRTHPPAQPGASPDQLERVIVERSGKRPGTIPCLACPGRMANLGAQKCRTHEGDDRTFSIWRCRQCLGYYLNDWTDKWVRTDSLEVVDIYYRLAPQEAMTCLAVIEQTAARDTTPAELQAWAETYLVGHTPARTEVRRAR